MILANGLYVINESHINMHILSQGFKDTKWQLENIGTNYL